MTPQEMFNKGFLGVVKQGKPAYVFGSHPKTGYIGANCAYRVESEPDTKCAVGHIIDGLIPENSPIWYLNGGIDEIRDREARFEEGLEGLEFLENYKDFALAQEMQLCHDSGAERYHRTKDSKEFIENYTDEMTELAESYGLEMPVLPN